MLVLGFAGPMASGKGTATALVKGWFPGTPSVRFSDSLREFYFSFIFRFAYPHLRAPSGERGMSRTKLFWVMYRRLGKLYGEDTSDPSKCRELFGWIEGEFLPSRPWFIPSSGTRRDLQDISTKLRTLYREDILERAVRRRLLGMGRTDRLAIIEGIRREVDIATFLNDAAINFRLVYVDADQSVRLKRYRERNENPGDAEMTREQFVIAGEQEAERQITGLRSRAHLILDNSTAQDVLEVTLRAVVVHWMNECGPWG